MKLLLILYSFILLWPGYLFAQPGWSVCNSPAFQSRVDDIFMVNNTIGYAVCGDGKIVKTTDQGSNWFIVGNDSNIYCRSVEFINEQKGFVGSFVYQSSSYSNNILQRTTDGGTSWTDITSAIPPRSRKGICGLAVADNNTIYGCGNWYEDSAYIIKSTDGGYTWNLIDMSAYASSLIDMYFINKDVGFATGRDVSGAASVLHTTNGGATWNYKFQDNAGMGYCWKIQHLNDQNYYVSIESMSNQSPKIAKSVDGGMTWTVHQIQTASYYLEGVGFLNNQKGWAGGSSYSFQTNDGGITWNKINICPGMNRVLKVNDTLLFATGEQIWRYKTAAPVTPPPPAPDTVYYTSLNCYPNPIKGNLKIEISLSGTTHVMLLILDSRGRRVKIIENGDKSGGAYKYNVNTKGLLQGSYFVVLKTHEDKQVKQIFVAE